MVERTTVTVLLNMRVVSVAYVAWVVVGGGDEEGGGGGGTMT